MDQRHAAAERKADDDRDSRASLAPPFVTDGEREFWRREVAAERLRQRRGRPTPFPFQPDR
jgi:hypothetical protein